MASVPRLRRLEAQQTPVAKKVLDAAPYEEFWSSSQIATELYRQGKRLDKSIVEGCLRSLVRDGLLKESGEGFQRIRLDEEDNPVTNATPITPAAEPLVEQTPQEKLFGVVAKLHEASTLLASVAHELEDIILSIEDERSSNDAELEKLRRLKSVLRELG